MRSLGGWTPERKCLGGATMGEGDVRSFAEQLRRHRLAAELTQEELAGRAGLSAKAISKLERGERQRPYPHTVRLLATALRLEGETRAGFVRAALPPGDAVRPNFSPISVRPNLPPIGRFLGAVPTERLIGRQAELTTVARATDAVASGAGRFIVLCGEPGVGKTRLAQEIALNLERRQFLVLIGRCYETEQEAPFFPFLDVLAAARNVAPATLRRAIPRRWPELARLLPDDGQSPLPAPAGGPDEARRIPRAVSGFLEELSGHGPMAILLDDLHWVDESSLELVRHLARSTRNRRVLLLGAYRDLELRPDQPLQRALNDLDREGLIERIHLADLNEGETAELISLLIGDPDPSFAEKVQRLTDGNPFFTRELVHSLREQDALAWRDGRWEWERPTRGEVPASVRALIGQRVARLSPLTREVLRPASVLGERFELGLLAAVGAWREDDVEAALDEAAAAGLMRLVQGDTYTFDHALTRHALYAELGVQRRRRLHRAAAEALDGRAARDLGKRAAELAWHFREGRAVDRALEWSVRAGDQAESVFAHPEAERHYRQALALANETGDTRYLAVAQEKLGSVLATVARYDEALALLEPAVVAFTAAGDLDHLAATLSSLLWAHSFRGTPARGMAVAAPLLPRLNAACPSSALALLYVKLATLHHFAGRYDEQLRFGERAAELAVRVGDDRVLAEAEDVRGYALCLLGRLEEGLAILDHARVLAESTSHLLALANALGHLAISHLKFGSFVEAGREARRAVGTARRLGDPQLAFFWTCVLAFHRVLVGAWEDAHRRIDAVMRSDAAGSEGLTFPLFILGWLELLEGSTEHAELLLERSAQIAERTAQLQPRRYANHFLARLDLRNGKAQRAIDRLAPLLDRPSLEEQDVTTFLPCLAQAYLDSGDVSRARDFAAAAVDRARRQHHHLALVDGLRVLGMARLRLGHPREALDALEEARRLAHTLPHPYAEAQSSYELGIAHWQQGESDLAREHFATALALFEKLGDQPDAERARQQLGRLAVDAQPWHASDEELAQRQGPRARPTFRRIASISP